jgi:hypothetical protein
VDVVATKLFEPAKEKDAELIAWTRAMKPNCWISAGFYEHKRC